MKLEEMLVLSPKETLLLVIDIQRDFLESEKGFAFHDAKNDTTNMQRMVMHSLLPFINRSLEEEANVAYVKSEYPRGKFEEPYNTLCSELPGTDFYLIDIVTGNAKLKRIFTKLEHDPFTNPDLRKYIEEWKISNLILTGVTLTNCIKEAVQSAFLIPGLRIVVPEDCVSYRMARQLDAQEILANYGYQENKNVIVVNSNQIRYKHG